MRRDQLNDEYLELLDKQRLYFKTVKDFKEVRRPEACLLTLLPPVCVTDIKILAHQQLKMILRCLR